MNAKLLTLIILVLLTGVNSSAQVDTLPSIKSVELTDVTWGDLYVATTDGIFIREKPSVHSKAICSIPFGEKVKYVENWEYGYPQDSTEFELDWSSFEGWSWWVIVSYGKYKGFAFAGYLRQGLTSKYDKNHSSVQLLFEGGNCIGELIYNPDLHWYGYYLMSEKEKKHVIIKPVEISITTFDGDEGAVSTVIKTNQPEHSLFLFGMEKEIKHQNQDYYLYYDMGTKLYPGQQLKFFKSSQFYATGCADTTIDEYGNYLTDYNLMVKKDNIIQDLTKEFNFKTEQGYQIITWCGDLNGDDSPDAIFTTGGYHGINKTLYIGSAYYNDESSVMKKASTIKLYNCY